MIRSSNQLRCLSADSVVMGQNSMLKCLWPFISASAHLYVCAIVQRASVTYCTVPINDRTKLHHTVGKRYCNDEHKSAFRL